MITPFLKWVGGKKQIITEITSRLPKTINKYYEPFVGGGAVFFSLNNENSIINDCNRALMNSYIQVRDYPDQIIELLSTYDKELINSKNEFYYKQRTLYNSKIASNIYDIETAALFIFLNKHCFNGVYRVNRKGFYNVPYNTSLAPSFDKDIILNCSKSLQNTIILCEDFEMACDSCRSGDFIYFDPPYAPLNKATFSNYTKEGFVEEEQIRLSKLFKKLASKGCNCMLSNHNTELINELYKDYNISLLNVRRSVNRDGTNRAGQELIITSY